MSLKDPTFPSLAKIVDTRLTALETGGGPHTHEESEIVGLVDDLAAKAANDHNHDGTYATAAHNHDAAYAELGHNHDASYAAIDHTHVGGSTAWGGITGTLANQTDLQTALDGKQASGSYEPANANIQSHIGSSANPHSVTKAQVGLGSADNTSDAAKPVSTATQTALDGKSATSHTHAGVYEPANANIQAHVIEAHAPANAQKNSDILKSEIETVLTGEISTHTHAGGGGSPFLFEGSLAADAATGANVTPISLTGLVFSFVANSRYWVEIVGATRAAATTTGSGFQLDVSAVVTRVGLTFVHQLANTGTTTGGSSIADDASVGVSSGRPSANVDTPVMGVGYLITGANAGTAQLRYRSEVAAVSTVMSGLMMRVRKLP